MPAQRLAAGAPGGIHIPPTGVGGIVVRRPLALRWLRRPPVLRSLVAIAGGSVRAPPGGPTLRIKSARGLPWRVRTFGAWELDGAHRLILRAVADVADNSEGLEPPRATPGAPTRGDAG